jgi:hypothetical protein
MTAIGLSIALPAPGAVFEQPKTGQAPPVVFQATANVPSELAGVPTYFRWYSGLNRLSLDADGNMSRFSLNETALTDAATPFSVSLPMGTNVISLAASDRAAEAELENSRHGGVTGGVDKSGAGYVIHILKANIVSPTGSAPINVTHSTPFQVEAPWPWDDEVQYKLVNKLRFSWLFVAMSGDQPDPSRENLTVYQDRMTFKKSPPILELNPETYQHLHGRYRATLQVEAGMPPTIASDSIDVMFP